MSSAHGQVAEIFTSRRGPAGRLPASDAVRAALPALGPVTVQARKTCLSLVTPRRTFAVVLTT